jgi:hypothetical protein
MTVVPNKPDPANPAMTLWLTIDDHWRRVADLERWPITAREQYGYHREFGLG